MNSNLEENYLQSCIKQFNYYKTLGEKAIAQIADEKLFYAANEDSNSIAIIIQHLSGNMVSRWTDFLTSDGEKSFRNRDQEFEPIISNKSELLNCWDKGWKCLLDTLSNLNANQLDHIVYIRNEGHTVMEAINRQLCHYSYHIGQIVLLSKMYVDGNWSSLSIPKNSSQSFNSNKFNKEKDIRHFTDDESK